MIRLKAWDYLPDDMKDELIRPYYESLRKHKISIALKRLFDIIVSIIMLVILLPVMLIIAAAVKLDTKGPAIYKQERITTNGRHFKIWKFRTMVSNADSFGTQVTVDCDSRVTKVGRVLRGYRLDELPQLLNILVGDMSFVGTRPEVVKYVKNYTPIMRATLLLPAGVTSEASILYKDESELISSSNDVDRTYIEQILPEKMFFNLRSIERFSFISDLSLMFKTVFAVLGVNYQDEINRQKPPFAMNDTER